MIEEFKRRMNTTIRRKLIEVENQPSSIEQWFKRVTALNRNWRESKREEERIRGKKESNEALTLRSSNQEVQRQSLPWPQVWPRRQEMPQQQVLIKPAPMKGVERTNVAITRLQQQGAGFSPRNPYAINVDKRENKNCYVCRGFGHLARNCRNREMGTNRRIEVEQDNNNLKEEWDLIVFG